MSVVWQCLIARTKVLLGGLYYTLDVLFYRHDYTAPRYQT